MNITCTHCGQSVQGVKFKYLFFPTGREAALHLHCEEAYKKKQQREEAEARTFVR